MRIALVTVDIKTEAGRGIAVYTKDLSNGLRKAGLYVNQFFHKRGSLTSLFGLLPKLKNYDIIHIQHEYNLFGALTGIKFLPFIASLKLIQKKKIVVTMHTIHDKKEKIFPDIWWWTWMKRNILYPLNNKVIGFFSNTIITHTNFLAKKLNLAYKIKKKKLYVIPQGIKLNSLKWNKRIAKKKLGIKGKLYLMIGNLSYQQGSDIIVKEAKEIGGTILVVGDISKIGRDYVVEMENFVNKNKLENVRFDVKDRINSDKDMWWLYFSAADLILLPYRVMTTSGIFINAMEVGKPSVCCDSEYFKEISKKYGCIKIAENEKDYPRVIKEAMNPKNYKKMVKESKKFKEDNSILLIGKRHKKLYELLLK